MFSLLGEKLAQYLNKPSSYYEKHSTISPTQLLETLQPCDLLLVEGNSQISTAIKYLTQSTWSHVCIFTGDQAELKPLLEASVVEGVTTVPIDKYEGFNLRICRPVGLTENNKQQILDYVLSRIGHQYDTRNIFDLMRYLIPTPPVPTKYRRNLLAFGSGDPTKAICSTLVAQAFQSIKYPILPTEITASTSRQKKAVFARKHYSHFTPRDFDLSPYFEIIKPTIASGFDYKILKWEK